MLYIVPNSKLLRTNSTSCTKNMYETRVSTRYILLQWKNNYRLLKHKQSSTVSSLSMYDAPLIFILIKLEIEAEEFSRALGDGDEDTIKVCLFLLNEHLIS